MISDAPPARKFHITITKQSINSDKMYKIKRLLHIHIILIYFTFIYSQGYSSSHKQAHASSEETTPITTPISDEMTEEQARDLRKEYKALAMERLFDIKGKPSQEVPTNTKTKLNVPSAMLKQYIGYRDEVRAVVPDDQDFFGRINIDAFGPSENIWTTARIGDFDVEVEMPSSDGSVGSESFRSEDASHIGLLPLACDPEDIPLNIAPTLPPHLPGMKANEEFVTVHLKYNLSQEIYSSPTAASDFKRAELRLTRERVNHCDSDDCTKTPISFFANQEGQSDKIHKTGSRRTESHKLPRYQMVYILPVHGYDKFNEPQTSIHTTRRIDTRRTTPLSFDISEIVREWLEHPERNFGIIVRIANDDKQATVFDRPRTNKREANSSLANDSDVGIETTKPELGVLEHVRLKRAFQSKSDNYEIWRDKQPSILIWSKPERQDTPRRHVKRHHSEQEGMQADEPDTTTADYQHTSTVTIASHEETQHTTHVTHTDKPPHATSSGSHSKREHVPTATSSSGGRRGAQAARASSSGRPTSQQGSRPKGKGRPAVKQSDKCSKRSLNINFDEVGWSSWIIAPHSYNANYCSGDCNWPLSDTQNSTNHAIIQSIYRSVGRLVPKSCCAPVKLGRMAILYQLDGIVQMRLYDDMIVEACGCL
uniref:Bone morphogenetic protein 4 n=1 Tax=Aceria tosichella TaxID=561515 RepID=A0A6G1SIA1_9ACAR